MSSGNPYELDPYRSPQIDTAGHRPTVDAAISQLSGTRTGLQLVYWGIVVILLALVLLIGAIILMVAMGGAAGGGGIIGGALGIILVVGAVIVGSLMMFVGQCLCLTVPAATGAKGLITTTVAIQVLNLVVGIGASVASTTMGEPNEPNPAVMGVQLVSGILGMVGFFCFLMFIKKVAQFIGRHELAAYAGRVIGVFAVILAIYIAMISLMITATVGGAGGGMAAVGGCLGLVVLIAGIAGLCMYTTLLRNTITAISSCMTTSLGEGSTPGGASPGFASDDFGPTN